ncbi:hypothetical protein AZF37_04735 [endosymbiont 'TC1' of Trimyema compressum]|uniref:NAD(P)H-dependent glycerol-3-phosphate dehydrogenase n=1 Tax=endosymbiont 'TC1' of Trimyema compressum TaxID=243899 RepID=UPI0007F0BBAF|nr:NAD(P)H-dependent glycerol-3-phosphate dehydrogenase [endosymbiont 'TC1' of Trimyema compressum]AMP20568.1 hypothetical protein AZF37_04735 [endosymbiont 'TC1' of Trimyema compressum]
MTNISVIGLGSWGTALALHLDRNNNKVTLYGRIEDQFKLINNTREHPFLPGIAIPESINLTLDLKTAVKNEILVLAVPSPFVREITEKIVAIAPAKKYIINVAKGMEMTTSKRLSEVINDVSKGNYEYCILSGPTHAEEVARNMPAAIVAASSNMKFAKDVQIYFNSETLRTYTSSDVVGVELGGTLKNIIAIAAGFIDGMGFGDNAKAAIITRGLYEMMALGKAMGAQMSTFTGLTGMGDLVVTCTSKHSRNRAYGEALGKGKTPQEISDSMDMVAEGVYATKAIYMLSEKLDITMPITNEVYHVIYENKSPLKSFKDLMNREMKMEIEGIDIEKN